MSKIKEYKDRVVAHVGDNKELYIGMIAAAVAGGAAGYLVRGQMTRQTPADVVTDNTIVNAVCWKPTSTINQITKYYGDPGNHVRCIETGEEWLSQGDAARITGISPSYLSKHLLGRVPNCKGLHFELTDPHGLDIVKPAA
jgi:hypothetical protein